MNKYSISIDLLGDASKTKFCYFTLEFFSS